MAPSPESAAAMANSCCRQSTRAIYKITRLETLCVVPAAGGTSCGLARLTSPCQEGRPRVCKSLAFVSGLATSVSI
jgi:hypothetical protein